MSFQNLFCILLFLLNIIQSTESLSSPIRRYRNYTYSIEFQPGIADLSWSIDDVRKEITFEFHVNTLGWIALGISPAGGMPGADIGLGWIDQTGQLHFEDRHAVGTVQPLVDSTSNDWFGLQGREESGWTVIQFKRLLDTCDEMDVTIKSGTNIVIFAYDLEDPQIINGVTMIDYHENRRFTRMIPLKSYSNPPDRSKFANFDYFDFQIDSYPVPEASTTYYCQIFKVPTTLVQRRHVVAYEIMIDPANFDIVHHLLMYECHSTATFDDNNLPRGSCFTLNDVIDPCVSNIAKGWAVGGHLMSEFPENTGYPVGGNFPIRYYMLQMHYDNPRRTSGRRDSSGIRYYLGNQQRQHEIGYFSLGAATHVFGISIPPRADRFIIESYCPSQVTSRIPSSGINIISAFPHTHLQGRRLSTKIIRNGKVERYLFNAEAYDFNYQFENRLPQIITIFPGDELLTQCVYSTTNKDTMTFGGEETMDEMCLHMFTYYPRMDDLHFCQTATAPDAWRMMMNRTQPVTPTDVGNYLMQMQWNPDAIARFQLFQKQAPKVYIYGVAPEYSHGLMEMTPHYEDMLMMNCSKDPNNAARTIHRSMSYATLIVLILSKRFL